MSAGVPICTTKKLLVVWVQAKQLLQQPIPPKTFGIEEVCMYVCMYILLYITSFQAMCHFCADKWWKYTPVSDTGSHGDDQQAGQQDVGVPQLSNCPRGLCSQWTQPVDAGFAVFDL